MPRGRKLIKTIEIEERTLIAAAEEFYEHNRIKGLSETTQATYRIYVNCFVRWIGQESYLSDITPKDIDRYTAFVEAKGIKPISVATTMVHVRRFIRFCSNRGYMDFVEVTIPKYEKELKEPYTDEEMELLLKKPTSDSWVEYRNWCMVNYFYATGQRLSSVLNIKVKDVDLDERKVKLVWNKDKIQKYMPLSSALVEILREYIERSALQKEDYLFPEYEGAKLKRRSAEDTIAIYNKRRGVAKKSIHLFRHAFAKKYIMLGGNPVKLQHLLNHKTMEMTMNYVNLYGNDVLADFDLFNPLDSYARKSAPRKKRIKMNEL